MHNSVREPSGLNEPSESQSSILSFPASQVSLAAELPALHLCSICRNIIPFEYFRIRGQIACEACAVRARTGRSTESESAYVSALFFGVCGAIFSLILCAGFSEVTHASVGYFVFFVGWVVGKAMKQGANGLGGGRFQRTAVILTYVGISLAGMLTELVEVFTQRGSVPNSSAGQVVMTALVSPFLHLGADPFVAATRIVILIVGLCIAWRLTGSEVLSVDGPYGVPVS